MKLTQDTIQGTWVVIESEIDHLNAGGEIYRFVSPDRFEIEFNYPDEAPSKQKYHYELADDGFIYGSSEDMRFHVTAWFEETVLVFRPSHQMETRSKRTSTDS